ncbi:MAG: AbrB/MazE/SpoVT family DNA-binding domain-containing protein [Bryobacterales bacterium]|nr:AbrB/MazE/SpoVT family DNA-binding domain-containing protein [Bryobacterales bacterium]
MNPTAKIQHKGQVTIPTRLRNQAGLSKGDLVEFSLQRGKIVITPKIVIDRSQFPNADDEYTPAQRKIIDAHLAEGLADIKAGRTYGPFASHAEFIASLHKEAGKLGGKKTKRSGR